MHKYIFITFLFFFLTSSSQELSTSQKQLEEYSSMANNYFESGSFDSSIVYFNKAIKIATSIPDSLSLTSLLREQGKALELKGDFSASLASYLNAINNAHPTQQIQELGLSYLGLSNVNYRIYNMESAISNSIEASNIFKNLQDTTNYINASLLLAQVFMGLDNYEDATSIINDMFELAKMSNDSLQLANVLNYLGALYSLTEDYDRALQFFQRAIELNIKLENKINEGINLGNLGEIYMRKAQYQPAFNSLFKALEIEEKQNFTSGMIFLYYTLGETYSKINNERLALKFFNKSLELIDKTSEVRERPIVYKRMADHYARNGNYHKSYIYQQNYDEAKDSLGKLNTLFKIEEVKVRYEIEKKDHEYELLLNEKSQQEQKLASNKKLIKLQWTLILLVFAGLISSFIFTVYFFKSRTELKSTNKTKDILFSIIGHDLRGPMGNILQMVDLVSSPNFPEKEKYIQMIKNAAEESFILLNDLLAWSQTLDNKIIYNPRLISVNETIVKTFAILKSQAENKSIHLKSIVPNDILVFAEYNHFSTILRNLVSNAIKFTPQHGSIIITHESAKTRVKIMVTDSGIGIEPQNIKKILNTNSFFSTFGTNNEKGSGLGLVLCQKFIKINGGEFGIESTLGKGSAFFFTLPASSR